MTQHYVATLLYHPVKHAFVSILKEKGPDVVVGKWNFIGGKVEQNETPGAAHVREALEETGLNIADIAARKSGFTVEYGGVGTTDATHAPYAVVHFARYDIHKRMHWLPKLPELADSGERLQWYFIDHLANECHGQDPVVPNLQWIIPCLLSDDNIASGTLRGVS